MSNIHRRDDRAHDQIRPIVVHYDTFGYAHASVLLEQGDTKVLVGVTLQMGVPPFLKGQKTGWLSAEYAMLPHATAQRTQREANQAQRNARSVEISRLIGRCLRPTVDLNSIGERTIIIDCDVLQADGGTRVACITAASIALKLASIRWHELGMTEGNIFKEQIAGVSVGIVDGFAMTDLAYSEDSRAEADFNFVLTQNGALVEVQGTSEKKPISMDLFEDIKKLALAGVKDIFNQIQRYPIPSDTDTAHRLQQPKAGTHTGKQALFSLANRLKKSPDGSV